MDKLRTHFPLEEVRGGVQILQGFAGDRVRVLVCLTFQL